MAGDWVTISAAQLSRVEPMRNNRGHSFVSPKFMPWLQYCRFCGHVALKNDISVLITRIGCDYEGDPRYVGWLLRTKRRAVAA